MHRLRTPPAREIVICCAVELLAGGVEHSDIEKEGRSLRRRHPKALLERLREARQPFVATPHRARPETARAVRSPRRDAQPHQGRHSLPPHPRYRRCCHVRARCRRCGERPPRAGVTARARSDPAARRISLGATFGRKARTRNDSAQAGDSSRPPAEEVARRGSEGDVDEQSGPDPDGRP